MGKWLDQYTQELNKDRAVASVVSDRSPFDIAHSVLGASPKSPVTYSPSTDGGPQGDTSWFSKLIDALGVGNGTGGLNAITGSNTNYGLEILDKLSRPGQAVQGTLTNVGRQENKFHADRPNDTIHTQDINWLDALGAGAKAFTGEAPAQGKDTILAIENKAPNAETDWKEGLGGLALDVTLDPLNAIPTSWVGKIARLGKEVALPGGIVKNSIKEEVINTTKAAKTAADPMAAKLNEVTVTPEQAAAASNVAAKVHSVPTPDPNAAVNTVNGTVPTGAAVNAGATSPLITPFDPNELATVGKVDRVNEIQPPDEFSTPAPTPNVAATPEVAATQQAVGTEPSINNALTPEAVAKALEGTSVPKYKNIPEPFHKVEASTKTVPGDPTEYMKMQVAEKIMQADPESHGFNITAEGDFLTADGKTIDNGMWDNMVENSAKSPEFYAHPLDVFLPNGNTKTISAGILAKAAEKGIAPFPEGSVIQQGNEMVSIQDVVKELHTELSGILKDPESIIQEVTTPETITPFTKEERAAWKEEVSKTVDPEDLVQFAQRGVHQYGAYSKNVQKVLSLKRQLTTLDHLEQAVKDGHINKKALAKILDSMGVKSIDEAKSKLESIDAAKPEVSGPVEAPLEPAVTSQLAPEAPSATPAVMSADDIITHAETTGDTSMLDADKKPVALTADQKTDVQNALVETGFKEFTQEGLKNYKHPTKTGANTTSPEPYGGLAHKANNFNMWKTLTLWNNLAGRGSKALSRVPEHLRPNSIKDLAEKLATGKVEASKFEIAKTVNKLWDERGAFLYDEIVPSLKAAELTIKAYGIQPILGSGVYGLPISMHDIIMTLPRKFSERYLFSGVGEGSRHIPPTTIMQMVRTTLYHTKDGMEFLKHPTSPEYVALVKELEQKLKLPVGTTNPTVAPINQWIAKGIKSDSKQIRLFAYAEKTRIIQNFIHAAPRLNQALEKNWADLAMQKGTYVQELSQDVVKKFSDDVMAVKESGTPTEMLGLVDNLDKIVDVAVKEKNMVPPPGTVEAVKPILTTEAAKELPLPEMKVQVTAAKAVEHAGDDASKINKINTELAKETGDRVEQVKGPVTSQGLLRYLDIGERLAMVHGVETLQKMFPHIGNAGIRPILLAYQTVMRGSHVEYRKLLTRLDKDYTRDEIRQAWKFNQEGIDPKAIVDDRAREVFNLMKHAMDFAVNPRQGSGLGIMNRVGIKYDQLNRHLERAGVPKGYRFDGRKTNTSMTDWKDWEKVEDPVELLSRVNAAVFYSHTENEIGSAISSMGSKVQKHGYVQIRSSDKNTIVDKVIDTSLWYPEDIAKQSMVLDRALQDLMNPNNTSKFVRFMDDAIKSYKTRLTIYNIGHHVRNTIGDLWLMFMDGMSDPRYLGRGHEVLQSHKELYGDILGATERQAPKGSKTQLVVTHKGKRYKLTNDQVYALQKNYGNLPDVELIEDISADGNYRNLSSYFISGAGRNVNPLTLAEKVTGGRVKPGTAHRTASKVSEVREHNIRSAHWLYTMERDFKTLNPKLSFDEAIREAALKSSANVRKWHPDGSDLTAFERKYLRRTTLFYSWIRKAAPLVMYSMLVRPARFTAVNKATQALAASNGIDISYGDPFPEDQLFPEWLTQTSQPAVFGQAGGYFSMNPGIPGYDVLQDYAPNTRKETLLGGLAPQFKYPLQLLTHQGDSGVAKNFQTGGDYNTWVDFLTSGVPNMGLTETVAGSRFPGRTPEPQANQDYESQFNLPGGATINNSEIAWLNNIMGLGIRDLSKPSYINSARIDQQNKVRDAARGRR